MIRKRYHLRRLVLAFGVAAIAASGAQAQAVRPDDRADRGIATPASGPVSVVTLNDRAHHGIVPGSEAPPRPDDRADRSIHAVADATLPVNSAPIRIVEATGFDWADAGIGAAAGFGFMLLAAGGAFVAHRRRKSELAAG